MRNDHDDADTNSHWDRIGRAWLGHYVTFVRPRAERVQTLLADVERCAAVPMPRALLSHLSASPTAPASSDDAADRIALVRHVAAALESGDLDAAMTHVADDYEDLDRDRAALEAELRVLLSATRNRGLALVKIDDRLLVGDRVVSRATVAWAAEINDDEDDSAGQRKSGELIVTIVFARGAGDAWRIACVEAA